MEYFRQHTERAELLDKLTLLAAEHYSGGPVLESTRAFLARIINVLPVTTFSAPEESVYGRVYIMGALFEEADSEVDNETVGQKAIRELLDADVYTPPDDPITLYISSYGGDVMSCLAIMGTIRRLRAKGRKINAHVMGYAMSAAFDIVQHCDHRSADRFAGFMLHEEQGQTEGSTEARMSDAVFGRKMEAQQLAILSERTGKPVKFYTDKIKGKAWYLTAKEALDEGFIDEIVDIPPLPKAKSVAPAKPRATRKAKLVEGDAPTA